MLDTGSWRDGSAIIRWSSSLFYAGAPVGTLGCTSRTLRGANGTGIGVSGCSHCVVSFMGLMTEFPILVCDLATGTDAIIGTDVLVSVLPHTLDIKKGLLFTDEGASLQLHRRDTALSGSVFTVGHCSIPPYSEDVLHCTVHTTGSSRMPSSGLLEGLSVCRKYRPRRRQNWWIRLGGEFRSSCPTLAKIQLWWSHSRRWAW